MTNIEQFTRELMLAHDIDYETAQYRAYTFYENIAQDVPSVLNDWISVEDRLPNEDEVVLVFSKESKGICGEESDCYNKCRFQCGLFWIEEVHDNWSVDAEFWQPLPKPPKEK